MGKKKKKPQAALENLKKAVKQRKNKPLQERRGRNYKTTNSVLTFGSKTTSDNKKKNYNYKIEAKSHKDTKECTSSVAAPRCLLRNFSGIFPLLRGCGALLCLGAGDCPQALPEAEKQTLARRSSALHGDAHPTVGAADL